MKILILFIFHLQAEPVGAIKPVNISRKMIDDMTFFNIQNAKDDEEIYFYGLQGQEDPRVKMTGKILFSNFQKIMKVIKSISIYYNEHYKLIPEADSVDPSQAIKKGLADYRKAKEIVADFMENYDEIKSEVDMIFENAGLLEVTLDDCLEIFGFTDYVLRFRDKLIINNGDYLLLLDKLTLIVYDFVTKLKGFLNSLNYTRQYNRVMEIELKDFPIDYNEDSSMSSLQKIDLGVQVFRSVLGIKTIGELFIKDFIAGIDKYKTIRGDILEILIKMEDLSKLNPQHKSSVSRVIVSTVLSIFCLMIFFK